MWDGGGREGKEGVPSILGKGKNTCDLCDDEAQE